MASHSSILAWGNPMDRGAWWATVHRVARVRHNLVIKPAPLEIYFLNGAAAAAAAKSLQSCPTLCDSIDGRPPGSPVPGILQARTLESLDTVNYI